MPKGAAGKDGAAQRETSSAKIGCPFKIVLSKGVSSELWRVVEFKEEHNHAMLEPEERAALPRVRTEALSNQELKAHLEM